MKCLECGREFEKNSYIQKYCGIECYNKANRKSEKIKKIISKIARINDFDVKNKEKIIRAKMMCFKNPDELKRCPCDANNPKRFCGSKLCISDVVYLGHCHCNLFWSKDAPEIEKHKEDK